MNSFLLLLVLAATIVSGEENSLTNSEGAITYFGEEVPPDVIVDKVVDINNYWDEYEYGDYYNYDSFGEIFNKKGNYKSISQSKPFETQFEILSDLKFTNEIAPVYVDLEGDLSGNAEEFALSNNDVFDPAVDRDLYDDQFLYLKPLAPDYPFEGDYDKYSDFLSRAKLESYDYTDEENKPNLLQLELDELIEKRVISSDGKTQIKITIIEESIIVIPALKNFEQQRETVKEEEEQLNWNIEKDVLETTTSGKKEIFLAFGWTLMITGVILTCLVVYAGRKMAKNKQKKIFVCRGQLPYEPLHSEV